MRKYEEALERAKQGLPIDEVFPELKESEDERIRKMLIEQMVRWKKCAEDNNVEQDVKDASDAIAYLEKQKDERELSFIEGKIEGVRQTCQEIKDAMYLFEPKDLTPFESTFRDYVDSAIRYCLSGEGYQQYIKEWAADLLNLEKQKEQKPESCDCSRDEESYTNGIHHVLMNPEAYGLIKQKPAEWSEEDERNIEKLDGFLSEVFCYGHVYLSQKDKEELQSWLKSLRPQPHWKPSEEQMEALRKVTYKMGNSCFGKSWANDENLHSLYIALEQLM